MICGKEDTLLKRETFQWAMAAHTCNPSSDGLRQEDCWECEASTSYIGSPMSVWTTEGTSVSIRRKNEGSKVAQGVKLDPAKPDDLGRSLGPIGGREPTTPSSLISILVQEHTHTHTK